uniref:Secreted protein n=1 Tax=Meloidogyne incognita TaxID=6306 RepID=A0A914KZ97_MELIC
MRTRLPFPFSSFSCPCFLVLVFLLHFFNEILFLLDLARYHLDRIWRSWTGCGNMVECMKMGNGTGNIGYSPRAMPAIRSKFEFWRSVCQK